MLQGLGPRVAIVSIDPQWICNSTGKSKSWRCASFVATFRIQTEELNQLVIKHQEASASTPAPLSGAVDSASIFRAEPASGPKELSGTRYWTDR